MSSPVNPYQPSAHASEPRTARFPLDDSPGPHYQARLTWADRQMLLKSLGPIRLTVVIGSLYWLKSVAVYAGYLANIPLGRGHFDAPNLAYAALAGSWIFQGVLHFYAYRLDWLYAEGLQALAGGHTGSHRDWTRLHYRTWWLSVVCWVLAIATDAGTWLVQRWVTAAGLGP